MVSGVEREECFLFVGGVVKKKEKINSNKGK